MSVDVVRADKMLLTKDQAEASTEPIWQKIDFEKEVPVDKLTRYGAFIHVFTSVAQIRGVDTLYPRRKVIGRIIVRFFVMNTLIFQLSTRSK